MLSAAGVWRRSTETPDRPGSNRGYMDVVLVGSVAAVVAAVVGFFLGRGSGRRPSGTGGSSTSPAGDGGREQAFELALSRIGSYLRENVDGPLSAAFKDRRKSLRRAAEEAVAAVDDLQFFLEAPSGEIREEDLTGLVKDAVRDYEADWDVSVLVSSKGPVQVRANAEALLDALYLVLHNAGTFGKGEGVMVTVSSDGEWGHVLIQDGGPGFTAEALSRAYDPFYTTSEGGLGLGLSHARKAIEFQAGRIHLRNRPEGGAEVDIAIPLA